MIGLVCPIKMVAQNQVLLINDSSDEYFLNTSKMNLYIDSSGVKTFESIKNLPNHSFKKVSSNSSITSGYKFPIWVKFNYVNQSKDNNWVYELIDFRIDDVTYFYPNQNNKYDSLYQGDNQFFEKKTFQHKNHVFKLPVFEKQDTITVYFKFSTIQNREFVLFSKVRTVSNFTNYALNEYFLLALFYGMICFMAIYNIFLYISIKEHVHLVYVFYIINVAIYCLSRIDGLAFQYLWPDNPSLNAYIDSISLATFTICAMWFAITFLDMKSKSPGYHNILLITILIRISILLIGQFYRPILDYEWLDLFCVLLTFVVCIIVANKQFVKYQYFIIAFGLMSVGYTIFVLQEHGIIPGSIIAYYSLNFGIIGESFFLSFGISEKTRQFLSDRNKSQQKEIEALQINTELKEKLLLETQEKKELTDKINRELEQKVTERTIELQKLNENLKKQKEEISKLNSLLDVQNWELKKEINQKDIAKIVIKNLTYNEFLKIFETESSCYKYLAELKWDNSDNVCSSCSNNKWNRLNLKSRKCTRCGHIESVTSQTVFHGTRFSIQKGFYMIYQYLFWSDNINISELSEKLEMRRATCSDFIQKLKERHLNFKPNEPVDFETIIISN